MQTQNNDTSKTTLSECLHLVPVPLCYQETPYTCGVACVQSILASYGILYRQDILIEMLKQKPILGTDHLNMISFMQMLGFQAALQIDMSIAKLKEYIGEGITPVLMLQAWKEDSIDYRHIWRDSHYVIACGYDENTIIFMDPFALGNFTYITYSELADRWHSLDSSGNHIYNAGIIIKNVNCKRIYDPNQLKHME